MKLSISMSRRETLFGWSYLLISLFVLPFAFAFLNSLLESPLSDTAVNLIYFCLNFASVIVIFHRFLRRSVQTVFAMPWRVLRYSVYAFFLYYIAVTLLDRLIGLVCPDFANVNDFSIGVLLRDNYTLWAFATIWLVPVTEELFYRGLIFQGLQRTHRLLAYCVSTLIFAGIHIIGYIGQYDWLTLALCYIQYLPAGLALAWTYEKSDTIIAPILVHITVNQIAMSAMR